MANSTVLKSQSVGTTPREIPHTVSPGLWALAWKRLSADKVAMVSLAIVAAFIVMMVLSGTGLIAADWNKEVGVNYAPPSFVGADEAPAATTAAPAAQPASTPAVEFKSSVVDPLADVLAELRGEKKPGDASAAPGVTTTAPPATTESGKSVDPLADVMADIKADRAKAREKGGAAD